MATMAKLYFNYSTMNAGKSTALLQASHNYRERGMETFLITAQFDNRAGEGRIASRIGIGEPADTFAPGEGAVEVLNAAERLKQLADDPELIDPNVRTLPTETPREGVGVVEAPRGTLLHHYRTDERGVIEQANLIVATQNNSARMAMSVEKAAKGLISKGHVSAGILNKIEMAFRAYDPCHACATHSLPGSMPLVVAVRGPAGETLSTLRRDSDGSVPRE